jgi:hypothetical protein
MNVFQLKKTEDSNDIKQKTCTNCSTIITCGCQWVEASDGTRVCDECLVSYEEKLNSN